MSLIDVRGTVHEVTVSEESRDYWTAGGVMLAACACGWADRVAYAPGSPFAEAMTKDFADLKLRERASAHVPLSTSPTTEVLSVTSKPAGEL